MAFLKWGIPKIQLNSLRWFKNTFFLYGHLKMHRCVYTNVFSIVGKYRYNPHAEVIFRAWVAEKIIEPNFAYDYCQNWFVICRCYGVYDAVTR